MNDLDLMLHADGEGDPASPDLAASADDQAKIEGIRELGGLVRGHLELSADDADDRLASLWDLVERRLDADVRAEQPAAATPVADPGLWAQVTGWLGRYRSQVLTGLVTAGAAAAITMLLRPAPHTVTRTVAVANGPAIGVQVAQGGQVAPTLTLARATPAEVESLEVTGGSGTVFTIKDDDDGADGSETTVIWVTPDDVGEGL